MRNCVRSSSAWEAAVPSAISSLSSISGVIADAFF